MATTSLIVTRTAHAMSVIPLTIFCSLLLAGLFVALFVLEQRRTRFTSAERDSLLPLAEEGSRSAGFTRGPAACGCRQGSRVPCAACLERRDRQDPAYF